MTTSDNRFIRIVHELGPTFAARAADADREGRFIADNYGPLKQHKLLSAGVPADLGGGGATYAELCDMIRTLAHYCPSTSLALSMHTHLLAAAVWRNSHGQPAVPLLQKVAESELVLVSTGAGDWLESNGNAVKVDGGFRVTAQKRFASGCPAGDMALTSAPYEDPTEGWQVLHFAVPMSSQGVRVGDDWNTLGMRATGSHTLHFENVFVPDAAVSVRRPRGKWHPSFSVVSTIALPIVMSTYVGVAEAGAELARAAAKQKKPDSQLITQVGQLENQLCIAQMCWREMVGNARNYDFVPELERASGTLSRKTIGAAAVRATLDKAVEISGGGAFFRKSPLERLWRDAQAVQFHPLPEAKQLDFTGRVTLGLPPVA